MKKYFEKYQMNKRFLIFVLILGLSFSILGIRLFFLTIIDSNSLQALAAEQWLRSLPLSAKRGDIVDSNGNILATTTTTYDIYIRARNVTNPSYVSKILADTLNLDYDSIYAKAINTRISESLVKMQVDYDTSIILIQLALDGVYYSQNMERVYPYADSLTQVLGYTTIDNVGQAGVESYYDTYLSGTDGKSLTQTDAQGKELEDTIQYYIPSTDGMNLQLSININLQLTLEKYLSEALENCNAQGVSGIILDANTGGVLAMSNQPSFDLNDPPRDDVASLTAMTKNSCVVDVYEPGSTFKIFTMAIALNEGLTDIDELFDCCGSSTIDGENIKCWKTTGHGTQTLAEAFKNSCNCVFMELAQRIGVEKYYEYLELFGFGEITGIDISAESAGIVMDEDSVRIVDLARIGFGQSIAVTPIQMVTNIAKVLTNQTVEPYIVSSIYSDTDSISTCDCCSTSLGLDEEVVELLCSMLGTNLNGFDDEYTFVPGYDIGGKTGTAQKYKDGVIDDGKYISSFVGVYPASDPEYIMLITVDEPEGAYYGGVVAAPIGKSIFTEMFDILNISPDDVTSASLNATIEMPNLVGMSISDADDILSDLSLYWDLDDGGGTTVVAQLPVAGTYLFKYESVVLIT